MLKLVKATQASKKHQIFFFGPLNGNKLDSILD